MQVHTVAGSKKFRRPNIEQKLTSCARMEEVAA